MGNKRHFKPKTIIPEQRLLDLLKEGYTLDDIGEKFHKSRSYISELCTMYGIKVSEIDGRKEKMRERYKKKRKRSFLDVMYEQVNREVRR